MSNLVIPVVLANGTGPANIVDAVGLNANFTAIATAVNNIYPSQIIPTTTGQATFGGNQPYLFLAGGAAVTPLTVSGVSGQSAAILQATLTSGGTPVFKVDSTGALLAFQSAGTGLGTVAPTFGAAGTSAATTLHDVFTTFAGTGGTVNVALTNSSVYTSGATYIAIAYDTVTGTLIGGVTASGSSVNFNGTTNGHTYLVILLGV